ncbi:MAG: hypothetical protein GXO89_07840, partial [Chlorobi bacterium]|nr:hypothetical protein [Chlorobiota bacterium]
MKKMITILILTSLAIYSFGQIPEITWQNCFGTDEDENAKCILKTDNGYLLGITLESDGPGITNFHGVADAWIISVDTVGNVIWEKCFGGSEAETSHQIIKASNHNYYLLNSSNSTDGDVQSQSNGLTDFWIVKIDEVGNILWERCYGSPNGDTPVDAISTPDGGLIFMGRIWTAGGDVQIYYGAYDIWFCKIDSLGNIEWEKTIGNEGIDNAINLKLTSDTTFSFIGGYYELGGMIDCYVPSTGSGADLWLVELNLSDGDILNQYCYGGSYNDLGYYFEKLDDGYILVSSTTSNNGDVSGLHGPPGDPNYQDIWVVRIDEQGGIEWQKCLGGSGLEVPNYIGQTKDGGFMVIGYTRSYNGDVNGNHSMPGDADIWVVKLDKDGEIIWQHCYGGWGNDRFWGLNSVVKKDDNSYIILAQSDNGSDDVECTINQGYYYDAWLFEIKDCSQYPVGGIGAITGPDTICMVYDSTNLYTIDPVTGAWEYGWQLIPNEAGTINGSGSQATVNWVPGWEGTASISVRAMNDCDTSQWSQPQYTEVFTCLGIEELNAGKVKMRVYPNPAKGFVIFSSYA